MSLLQSDGHRGVLGFSNYWQDRQRNLFIHKIKILIFLLSISFKKKKIRKTNSRSEAAVLTGVLLGCK